jgi:dynein heavy chain, axonemal
MVYGKWKEDLREKNIPNKDEFRLEKFLTNDVEISRWGAEGLPSDELSIQNGILTKNASRWPLCVDPQLQAVVWIKEKEKKFNLEILSFNQGDYIKRLEMAISFGRPVLFEAIDEEIDPMVDPILEKNIVVQAGVRMIKLGDSNIEYNDEFRMYMTTKIANPNYPPETFGKTMIINFCVTMLGLRDQLLNEVVGFERPELERLRKQLVIETSQNRTTLKELEDTLLSELSKETDIPLVDNVSLIETLENAKSKSVEIGIAIENAKVTEADIEQSRESYKDVAKRAAILFFAMQGLSIISEMYEYSLTAYLVVFKNALETARKDNILQNRLRNIKDKLTMLVYDFVCMGIFEKHKLMFSFQMTTMIMDGEGELNKVELDFFLKGNTSLEAGSRPNPFTWLSNNGWKDLSRIVALGPSWVNLSADIEGNEKTWKDWYDIEAPEQTSFPCGYSDTLSKFQQLLVVRIFRPDRVVNAIKSFIIDRMNDYYVKSPPINYMKIFEQSTEKTPIVFILSPGADPFSDVQKLVDVVGIGMNKFRFLALGQGMGDTAKQYIESGAMRGHWVMLQNCHLLVSWLKKLEAIIEGITKPDKNFRLWLTTAPSDRFPLGILQKSLKVVTEPPDGLGQNIKSSYTKLTDDDLGEVPTNEFKSLIYVLSFTHAVLQERKKFGKIGWNVNYDFNESDFKISFKLISLYLNKALQNNEEDLPWDTLRYLIGEAMYGGRVTDDMDRRVMNTYLKEYLGNFIFDTNQSFFFSKSASDYTIPQVQTHEQFMLAIDQIPLFTSPGVFGLHPNAEITYFTNTAKELWMNVLSMQTSDASAGGGINKEEFIEQVASDIQSKLPELFDYFNIKKAIELPSPSQVVLLQELERFNRLLNVMHNSLFDLKRALLGEIGMSQELDELANSLFNGLLPPMWSRLAPQTLKNLVNWMEHFMRRYQQYKEWIEVEEPKAMWLSGLHIPESYLTALVQTTCRLKNWALDKSTLYTVVTKMRTPAEIKQRLQFGCYIQGLYLEGARWSIDKDCLDYQNPKELVVEMPLIEIVPIEANKLKLRGTLKTPCYVTQMRRNAMGVGLVFEADLKTDKHTSHWVLQGVCLVLNTD